MCDIIFQLFSQLVAFKKIICKQQNFPPFGQQKFLILM